MKDTFFDALSDAADKNPDIEFIRADVGFNARYNTEHAHQCMNIGISEQNMIGVAGGMAFEGKTVFVYSLVDFTSFRVLDQIRVIAGYFKANIKMVTCGTGFDYCDDGVSHIAIDDIAVLRAIQNLTIFSPCDPYETYAVTMEAANIAGPCYIKVGRGGEPNLHNAPIVNYKTGQVLTMREGKEIMILVTGSIMREALTAADKLSKTGLDVGVYSFPTIKPLNKQFIEEAAQSASLIVTVEEHLLSGGFGSAVADVLIDMQSRKAGYLRIGVPDGFNDSLKLYDENNLKNLFTKYNPPSYLRKHSGIDADSIEKKILKMVGRT